MMAYNTRFAVAAKRQSLGAGSGQRGHLGYFKI